VPPNLFVALVPTPEALAPLAAAVARLHRQVPDLGWVAPARWHATLCFLGPVEPTGALHRQLRRAASTHSPLRMRQAGAGRFGNHVLWAGLEGNLAPLAADLARAAERAGFVVEDRPFRAHLTLARGRRRQNLRPLADELTAVEGPPWTAQEIVLLRRAQPEYERLATWPLAEGRPPEPEVEPFLPEG
jgi:RNA 2',3'-cyclic 3'-phosphodiesterase